MTTPFATPMVLPAAAAARALPAAMQAALCPGDHPLALFPVRLETRFFGNELRVRVYPDKVQIDSHEPELTSAEKEWGEHYWTQEWRAGSDETARLDAWRQLAERYEPARAAWIARVLAPLNPQDRPAVPVPPAAPLPQPIRFPPAAVAGDAADTAWRHAPQARLLPDRWVAVAQGGGQVVAAAAGRDIVAPVAVGPDPRAAAASVPGEQSAVDPGMRWMVDFDEAERIGMALRLTLTAQQAAAGIDSLFVLGAAAALAPEQAAARLADLLDAHHYTDGLAFVRAGTASNNTAERRSGYGEDEHRRRPESALGSDAPGSNAQRLGAALGLPAERVVPALGSIPGAAERPELDMRSMNTALWPVTWGYFLSNMVGFEGSGLTPALCDWARAHFVEHVRAGGPLPALRCGRQPYGVLPVTSLDLWQPGPGAQHEPWLRGMLVKLRDNVWRVRLGEVARIGRRTEPPDPDADLADVMRTEALSNAYHARSVLGRHYLQHLRAFLGEDLQALGFIGIHDAVTIGIVQRLGFTFRPRLAKALYAELPFRYVAPIVQDGEVSPWRGLEPNYIAALLAAPQIDPLIAAQPAAGTPLLQVLLRHALLREVAGAAAAVAATLPDASLAALLKDHELVDLVSGAAPTATLRRQLDLKVAPITGDRTIRQFLESLTAFQLPQLASLGEFRAALAHLQALDSEALLMLTHGTLDLASHRLDAWATSLAAQRLAAMRAAAPQGLRVGGYGWVENLRPAPADAAVTPPPGEAAPLLAPAQDSGYIHAPSMAQAATAALLRNAHLGASGVPQPDGPFAIDLSSRRVRLAQALLDGVRQGQPLAALLGYRLERSLHEAGFDTFIAPLRSIAPLVAGRLESTTLPLESIAANNVVDGLLLHRKWRDTRGDVETRLRQAGAGDAALPKLARELDALGDAIDAVSDALTAEAAYQMVRGNTARTAGTLAAIAGGDAPPPELEVARTPRTGTALTHRLLLLFSGAAPATPGWVGASRSARAAAEPLLNGWAAKLLGDARRLRCSVERLGADGAVVESRSFMLSELQIAPLDVVYSVDAEPRAGQPCELEQRVLYHAQRTAGSAAGAPLRLQHARPANLAAKELTLLDALEQARTARRLLAGARAAEPEDLTPPERAGVDAAAPVELEARTAKAAAALKAAHKALGVLVAKGPAADAESLRAAMLKLAAFGLPAALPASAAGDDAALRGALLLQAQALRRESAARVEDEAALAAAAPAGEPRARRQQLYGRLRAVFGAGFVATQSFPCGHAAELAAALAAGPTLLGDDPLAAHTWFTRCERVRAGAGRLGAALRGAEVLGTGERLALRVAQLPFDAADRWVALPGEPAAGKLSLVLQAPAAFDPAAPLGGLLVDEWVEVVPSRSETTALAFQFNPPDACAPQGVLLAVPPVPGQGWTVADLHRVLVETLDLAKLRGVDSEALGELGHYLPAIFLGFNVRDDAVSTDFSSVTR